MSTASLPMPAVSAPSAPSAAPWPRWVVAVAVLGGWLLLALLETTKEWVGWRMRNEPRAWSMVAAVNLPFWLYWAAVTPVIMALGRRFPLPGPRPARATMIHLGFSVVAAVGHAAVTAGLAVWFLGPTGELREPSFLAQFRPLAEGYLLLEMLVYWMILGVARAFVSHRRYLEARVGEEVAAARAARSEARASEARLRALRMELDPHFLCNALNAVSGLVREGDARGAVDMIARIGDLLRVTLRYGREGVVSLRRELEWVREYLAIEAIRIGDRLHVDIETDDDVLETAIPPLLLQPLVENAVRHGIAPVPGPGRLLIRARVEGDQLCVDVVDSGPGPAPDIRPGTGLRNIVDRIEEEFGGAGSLVLVAAPGGGSRATVRIPRRGCRAKGFGP